MGRKKDKTYSIVRRLIFSLTLTIGVVSCFASALLAMHAANTGKTELIAEADKSIVYLSRILGQPLWDFDEKRIRAIGEVYKEDRRVLQLKITDSTGKVLYQFQHGELTNSIQRSGEIMHGDRVMGATKLAFSQEIYREKVWQIAQATIISSLLLLLTIFATTGIMVRFFLQRPLQYMSEIINCYGSENYAPSTHKISTLEFQPFGEILSRMGGKIHNQLQELQTEISVREQAEEQMRTLRNYLKNIVDSMPSVLIGIDRDGLVTQWNKEAVQETGLTADQAQGKALSEVFPQLITEMDKIKQAIRERVVHKNSAIARQPGQGKKHTDITIYPLIANGVEGAVIRIDDVTKRVQIEEMMVQSEKMLSVGGLAAGMAHEINNPLAGIMQTTEVIPRRLTADQPANERAAVEAGTTMTSIRAFLEIRDIPKMLKRIRESGTRAAGIVSNMLDFARKGSDATSSHNLTELLDRSVDMAGSDFNLKKKYDFRNIEIIREYAEGLPLVPCEGGSIQQVMLNILRNGAEAMQENDPNRKPHFVLRIATEQADTMVRIEIEDNGFGMDEETRKRVFEPFFTTKQVGLGTGLGLSVSYFIITENHGGEMAVESQSGQGTKFVIRLPVEAPQV